MLGVRVIAYSFLASIAVLGGGGIYIAYATRGDVPKATTWLLYASGAVQALCGVCGIVGFKNLNRECMRWTFIILALSSFGLFGSAAAVARSWAAPELMSASSPKYVP